MSKTNLTIDDCLKYYSEGRIDFEDFLFLTGLSAGAANAKIQNYLQEKNGANNKNNNKKASSSKSGKRKKKEDYTILDKNTICRYVELNGNLHVYNFKGELLSTLESNSSNKIILEMEMYKQAKAKLELYRKQEINSKDRELLAKWANLIDVRDLIDGESLSEIIDTFSFNVANGSIDILEYQEYLKQLTKTHLGKMVYQK